MIRYIFKIFILIFGEVDAAVVEGLGRDDMNLLFEGSEDVKNSALRGG